MPRRNRPPRMMPWEIRAARERLELTPEELATLLETDRQTIYRCEAQESASTARKLPARAEQLIEAYLAGFRPKGWPRAKEAEHER